MTIKEQLKASLALLGPNGEYWAHEPSGGRGGKFCAVLALSEVCGSIRFSDIPAYLVLEKHAPGYAGNIGGFNDARETTFADVKALFERAIASCED